MHPESARTQTSTWTRGLISRFAFTCCFSARPDLRIVSVFLSLSVIYEKHSLRISRLSAPYRIFRINQHLLVAVVMSPWSGENCVLFCNHFECKSKKEWSKTFSACWKECSRMIAHKKLPSFKGKSICVVGYVHYRYKVIV